MSNKSTFRDHLASIVDADYLAAALAEAADDGINLDEQCEVAQSPPALANQWCSAARGDNSYIIDCAQGGRISGEAGDLEAEHPDVAVALDGSSANAEKIVQGFRDKNIAPDHDFTAAAGADYGSASAWSIPGSILFAVYYGNNGESNYIMADRAQVDDLSSLLIEDLPDRASEIIQIANILGADAVEEACDEDAGPFGVLISTDWYGPMTRSELAYEPGSHANAQMEFASIAEAQDWIDEQDDGGPTMLSHNQASGPDYKIVSL